MPRRERKPKEKRRERRRRYEGVTAYVGMPGSGKTYALAEIAQREMKRGKPVWCNAGFDVRGAHIFESFDDFLSIPNGSVVVWDELPLYVNARKWAEFPDGLFYRLTQIRKDGLQLYYSAIHEDMIDVNVRRITWWYWHCQGITARILRRSKFPPNEFRKQGSRRYCAEWVRVRDEITTLYDTYAKVSVAPKMLEKTRKSGQDRWVSVDGSASSHGGGEPPAIFADLRPPEGAVKGGSPEGGPLTAPGGGATATVRLLTAALAPDRRDD